jgi:hypothetical protein
MVLKLAGLAAVAAAGWFSFSTLVDVDTGDVVAYNQLDRHLGTSAIKAGDLVSIQPDGNPAGTICALDLEDGTLRSAFLRKDYVNGLRESLPTFSGLVCRLGGGDNCDGAAGTPDPARASFRGELTDIPAAGVEPKMSDSCACAVAQAVLRREQVCVVQRALVEQEVTKNLLTGAQSLSSRTVGATFKPSNVVITNFRALRNCPQVANANHEIVQQTGQCDAGSRKSFDVAVRYGLGIIREESVH